jgi:hypothetical protein
MAQLIVSGLDDDIKRRLQKRAEARPLGSCIAQRFAGIGLTEFDTNNLLAVLWPRLLL